MSDQSSLPLVSKKGMLFDLFLTVLFFLLMREVLIPHIPSQDTLVVNIVASMASFSMSGVFWIAVGMLRVTWADYLRQKKGD